MDKWHVRRALLAWLLAALLLVACAGGPEATPVSAPTQAAPLAEPTQAAPATQPPEPPAEGEAPPTEPAPASEPTSPPPTADPATLTFNPTDPSTVALAAGKPQLVEFFAFW